MIHKRRATPSTESGGHHTAAVVLENGERALGGAAFTRPGFPARGELRASRGSGGGGGGGGSGGCSVRGSLHRRHRGLESPGSYASSAAKGGGKKRRGRGPAGGSMLALPSFWFRVLCVTGGSFLLMMTAARRQGLSLSARRRRAAIVAAAVHEDRLGAEMEIGHGLQERRLKMAMKHRTFETTPHTLKDLLELGSGFSGRRSGADGLVDVTAILVASRSLDAQLQALIGGTVQPTQVWVVMPAIGTAEYKAKVARYKKRGQFEDRLHVVESDLFSDLPSGMIARDSRGVGGVDSGRFFNDKTGLFQLAMQAATKFIWVMDPGVLPGQEFLHLLAHVSTMEGMTGVYGSEGALMPAAPAKSRRSAHQGKHFPQEEVNAPFALWDDTAANTNAGTYSRPPPPPAAGEATAHGPPDKTEAEPGAAASAATFASRGAMLVGGAAAAAGLDNGGVSASKSVPVLSAVDVLFSQWFLDKDLVRLLFREKWLALESGDGDSTGLALSYSIRRYAGIPSYVLPSHPDLPEYSGDTRTTSSSSSSSSSSSAAAADPPAGGAAAAKSSSNVKRGREKKPFRSKNNGPGSLSPASAAAADHPDGGGPPNPGSHRLAAEGSVLGGVVGGGETAAAAAAGSTGTYSSSLDQRLSAPALSAQFRELSARAGHFFWTAERCPRELVLLVVDGRRQAELLEPLYRGLLEGNAAGAEVFVAVITQGPDESEQGGSPLEPVSRTARRDCAEVAEALGVVTNHESDYNNNNFRSRRASQMFGSGRGNVPRWLGGYDQDEHESRHFLSREEFCLGSAFGVFQVRAGQDYRQAPGRPLDPYLEVFHGLSEVLEATKPKIVAYIAAPPRTPDGKARGDAPTTTNMNMNINMNSDKGKGRRAGVDEMLAAAAASTGYHPADTVVRAVEAAVRSAADGGAHTPYPYRPIGVGLPPAAEGAEAAKALAYLPAGCLELWDEPTITLVLVHAAGEDGGLLSQTLRALSEAYYLGDRVELRLVLSAGDASNPTITQIVQGLEWEWGDLDVAYYLGADGDGNRLPAGLAALEAFPDPKIHDHIVPLYSGGVPDPHFYVWLKVALMNEAYAPRPVKGLPLDSPRLQRSLVLRLGHEESSAYSGGGGSEPEENEREGVYPADRGASRRGNSAAAAAGDSAEMWGKFLALSVDIPQGLCPWRDGCSRVWTYGSEAWGALRERCRARLASEVAGGGGHKRMRGVGHGRRQGELEPLEAACAVGDVAWWKGDEWGLEARRVCGAGPREYSSGGEGGGGGGAGGGKWERARVWEVYPVQQGGG
eukprot:g13012.t1